MTSQTNQTTPADNTSDVPPATWDDWMERFRPIGANDSGSMDGLLLPPRDSRVQEAARATPDRLWTLVECDGILMVTSGMAFVNREGYFITEVGYTGPECDFYYDEEDRDRDLEDEPEQPSITAQVFAIAASGAERRKVCVATVSASGQSPLAIQDETAVVDRFTGHYLLEMEAPAGRVVVALPGGPLGQLSSVVQLVLKGELKAEFDPEVWINNRAIPTEQVTEFNALPALIDMDLREVKEMFASGVDFDILSEGLPEREAHGGPFEVRIDEREVVRLVCLLGSMHEALGDTDSVQDITQPMWDDFCIAARGILSAKQFAAEVDAQEAQAEAAGSASTPRER